MCEGDLEGKCRSAAVDRALLLLAPDDGGRQDIGHATFRARVWDLFQIFQEAVQRFDEGREVTNRGLDPLQHADDLLQMSTVCWRLHLLNALDPARVGPHAGA